MLYSIGYQKLTLRRLQEIAEGLDATVVDCRVCPVSRLPGFSEIELRASLKGRYVWRGEKLGQNQITPNGIASISRDLDTGKTDLLLCAEESPAFCHRHNGICWPHFPEGIHIFETELIRAVDLQAAIDTGPDAPYSIVGDLQELLGTRLAD